MLTLDQIKSVDERLREMPDDELEKVRQVLYDLGRLALENWLSTKNVSKIPVGNGQKTNK